MCECCRNSIVLASGTVCVFVAAGHVCLICKVQLNMHCLPVRINCQKSVRGRERNSACVFVLLLLLLPLPNAEVSLFSLRRCDKISTIGTKGTQKMIWIENCRVIVYFVLAASRFNTNLDFHSSGIGDGFRICFWTFFFLAISMMCLTHSFPYANFTCVCAACERIVVRNWLFCVCRWMSQSRNSHTYVHQSITRTCGYQIQKKFQQRNDKQRSVLTQQTFYARRMCCFIYLQSCFSLNRAHTVTTVATYDNSTRTLYARLWKSMQHSRRCVFRRKRNFFMIHTNRFCNEKFFFAKEMFSIMFWKRSQCKKWLWQHTWIECILYTTKTHYASHVT